MVSANNHHAGFGPPSASDPIRRIIWEGPVGSVTVPDAIPGTDAFGNQIEVSIRKLLEKVLGQAFKEKASNAHGPDLVPKEEYQKKYF